MTLKLLNALTTYYMDHHDKLAWTRTLNYNLLSFFKRSQLAGPLMPVVMQPYICFMIKVPWPYHWKIKNQKPYGIQDISKM